MSIEMLNQLEEKIQQTVDVIGLLQMEIDELKEQKQLLQQKLDGFSGDMTTLQNENHRLKQEQETWQIRLQSLLSQINEIK